MRAGNLVDLDHVMRFGGAGALEKLVDLAELEDFDALAEAFTAFFPNGVLERHDFRSQFGGYGVSAYSTILPSRDEAATRSAARELLEDIAAWLQRHPGAFGPGDRLQLVVGFPESVKRSGRQIFKCILPASGLRDLRGVDFAAIGGVFQEMDGWPAGVRWSGNPGADPPADG